MLDEGITALLWSAALVTSLKHGEEARDCSAGEAERRGPKDEGDDLGSQLVLIIHRIVSFSKEH